MNRTVFLLPAQASYRTAGGLDVARTVTHFTRGAALSRVLGLTADEEMFGWIHLGRASEADAPAPREPLALAEFVTVLDGSGERRTFDAT